MALKMFKKIDLRLVLVGDAKDMKKKSNPSDYVLEISRQ